MKFFIISSLLFIAIYLPSLSLGVKCWQCKSYISSLLGGGCSHHEEPMHIEKDCGGDNCAQESYFKNNSVHRLGCDFSGFYLHEGLRCHKVGYVVGQPVGPPKSANLRYCTCGTDFCNKPNTERIQCFSCYGNRKGENEDDPFYPHSFPENTAVTDFVCKKDEKQEAIYCPLDAPVCMIKWDKEHRTVGCGSYEIPKGKISECSGYYFSGVGECYCNTNLCNTESLKELLPKTTTTTEPIERESESSMNEETDSKSKSTSEGLNLVITIVVVVVLIVIVAICILAAILILRRRNNPNQYAQQ